MKKRKESNKAVLDDVKICSLCGEQIVGDYEYIRTKRRHQEDMHTAVMSVQVMLAKSVLEQKCVKYKRNIENLLQRPDKRKI